MYRYVVVLDQNTPVVGKAFILGPTFGGGGGGGGGGGQQAFSFLQGVNRKVLKQLGGTDVFSIRFQFQEPLPPFLVVINNTSLMENKILNTKMTHFYTKSRDIIIFSDCLY